MALACCHADKVAATLLQASASRATITGDILKTKAALIARTLNIVGFKASDGFITGFKLRHGIKGWAVHGESGDADGEGVERAQAELPRLLEDYAPKEMHLPPEQRRDLRRVKPDLQHAVMWVSQAWLDVPAQAIKNCWRATGIMPLLWQAEASSNNPSEHLKVCPGGQWTPVPCMVAVVRLCPAALCSCIQVTCGPLHFAACSAQRAGRLV